ncbi:MAG: putative selenate reductase subunit YgfK [Oscillospiraceae bacterium]|jgi:putative selenate reductase|nr:putative selenate reductase subunit YgfK [Oscillospiraceae bacterium]
MSDRMRQIPFARLMDRILTEYERDGSVFGIRKLYRNKDNGALELFGESLELPFGLAAGPHTQLSQNLVSAYVAGGRFFELKTVQMLDGEELPVQKPCILAPDECYNVEWSTELYVPQALEEYIRGWFAIKLISRELSLGAPDGFIFNMSVGYDLEGIKTPKIDSFIEGLKNAGATEAWRECAAWARENLSRFKNVDSSYVDSISPNICRSITLSTLHGCPPDEIERIASYLLAEKRLHTFIKCNPTLLGYDYARKTLDSLGFGGVAFDDHHFRNDLRFDDAVPMLKRLQKLAQSLSLTFGVKLTNTFPVKITKGELPGEEMYMSGRSLFPLSIEVARRLAAAFEGNLRISYSGGADIHNIGAIRDAGVWPITLATTILKPGGYERLNQIAGALSGRKDETFAGVDIKRLNELAAFSLNSPLYRRPAGEKPPRKINKPLPLLDCFTAPCQHGCPLGQDIPAYLRLAGEGKYSEAMAVVAQRNPLPFITGTICSHRCTDSCTRDFYEGSVHIREVKLEVARKGYDSFIATIKPPPKTGKPVAVIGGGPAGLAAAYFLARAGHPVTVFEKRESLGGIVRQIIPDFRIANEAIDKDVALVRAMGVEIKTGREVKSLDSLRAEGFGEIIVAVGAWKSGVLELEEGAALGALSFLEQFKRDPDKISLGKNIVVTGGGNTAMDTARAAGRLPGTERVTLVYRRTRQYMPADSEELELALAEGVELVELMSPVSHKDGVLTCEIMELGEPDSSGRRSPLPTGRMTDIPADAVIAAVGDKVDRALYESLGVPVDGRGMPVTDSETLESGRPGVYIAGDARLGPSTVAQAIGDALRCAAAITGQRFEGCRSLNNNPDSESARSKKGILRHAGASLRETERCLECATVCECCVDVCPNRANISVLAQGKRQIVHLDALCNECGNCQVFCPWQGAPYRDKFTLFCNEEDFMASENPGFFRAGGGSLRLRLDGKITEFSDVSTLGDDIRSLVKTTEGLAQLASQ